MVVGILKIDLLIPQVNSLKAKRAVVRSIVEKTKSKFKVSVAEVSDMDVYQRSGIGISVVSNDRQFVNSILDKITDFIESVGIAQVIDVKVQIMSL